MNGFITINLKKTKIFLISILLAEAIGMLPLLFTDDISGFYNSLIKPAGAPPDWLFGVVWPILYVLLGIAAALVYKAKADNNALLWYAFHLAGNVIWVLLFFRFHLLGFSAAWLVLLLFQTLTTISLFYQADRRAGYLLVPYLLWLLFAFYLNFSIWLLN